MTQTDELVQELLERASEEGGHTGLALKRAAGRIAELEAANAVLRDGFKVADQCVDDFEKNGYMVGDGLLKKLITARKILGAEHEQHD